MIRSAYATPWAFFVRDFRLAVSYKAGFVIEVVGALVNVALFFYMSEFFGTALRTELAQYGGDYFSFVIIGIAFTSYLGVGLSGVSGKIRDGQLMGTLELMLISPTRLPVTLLSSALWSHAMATFGVATYVVAALILGVRFDAAGLPIAIVTIAIAIVGFNAIGLIAAAVVIVLKQGNPVDWLVRTGSVLLGGVFYPASVLPDALQAIAQLLPITHALEIVRRSLLLGEQLPALGGQLLVLVALTAIYLPLGILACHLAVRIAQRDGSLTTY
jgi:ABC-2 type transport system permease protein